MTAPATLAGQRERILDAALGLMADQGASGTSMRQLAAACGVNVATLYHYFPSKADLLRSVIEERQYHVLLRQAPIPDMAAPPRERLVGLMMAMWEGSLEEERIWRVLLIESFRGDATALAVGADLLSTIEAAMVGWFTELFPELRADPAANARVVVGQLYALIVENLYRPEPERHDHALQRAADLARLLLPD